MAMEKWEKRCHSIPQHELFPLQTIHEVVEDKMLNELQLAICCDSSGIAIVKQNHKVQAYWAKHTEYILNVCKLFFS